MSFVCRIFRQSYKIYQFEIGDFKLLEADYGNWWNIQEAEQNYVESHLALSEIYGFGCIVTWKMNECMYVVKEQQNFDAWSPW